MASYLAIGIGLRIDLASAKCQRNLGQLCGFTRTRLTTDDDDLVAVHGLHDFFTAAGYGKRFGERDLQRHKGRNYPRCSSAMLPASLATCEQEAWESRECGSVALFAVYKTQPRTKVCALLGKGVANVSANIGFVLGQIGQPHIGAQAMVTE